jgi:HEAT repeat protein
VDSVQKIQYSLNSVVPRLKHWRLSGQQRTDPNPAIRVLATYALVELKAIEALPRLRQLLGDNEKSNFGKLESVADAAQAAIAKLQ